MGLTADTAIVTAAEVAAITQEGDLANLSQGSATLAAALPQATNVLIVLLKARGVSRPDLIANVSDLKTAAGYAVAHAVLNALPDEASAARAKRYKDLLAEQVALYQFESSAGGNDQNVAPKGLSRAIHLNPEPRFARGFDDRNIRLPLPPDQRYVQK